MRGTAGFAAGPRTAAQNAQGDLRMSWFLGVQQFHHGIHCRRADAPQGVVNRKHLEPIARLVFFDEFHERVDRIRPALDK